MSDATGDISLKYSSKPFSKNRSPVASELHAESTRLAVGLTLSLAIGYAGWLRGSLSRSGFAGAIATGTLTTWRGGYGRAALLVGFFVASSLLSRRSASRTDDFDGVALKGGRRDIVQVAANGGISTLIAAIGDVPGYRLAYVGSLAAVAGDTWATEIGSRASSRPRHILTMQPVATGVSGGVSAPGTIASLAGGAMIGALAIASGAFDRTFRAHRKKLLLTGIVAGVLGSLVDSLAGATIQERRWCDACKQATERVEHTCGNHTRTTGGISGITNDGVNVICALAGAAVGWGIERRASVQR